MGRYTVLHELYDSLKSLSKKEIGYFLQLEFTDEEKKIIEYLYKYKKNEILTTDALTRALIGISSKSLSKHISSILIRFDNFLVEFSSHTKSTSSNLDQNLIFSKNQIIKAYVLRSRGLLKRELKLLNDLEEFTDKFEFFHEMFQCLRLKLFYSNSSGNKSETLILIKKMETCMQKRAALDKIYLLIDKYDVEVDYKSNKQSHVESLKRTLEEIESINLKVVTKKGIAMYRLIELEFNELTQDYNSYIKNALELIEFIKKEIAVFSLNRIIYLNNKLALFYNQKFEFQKSINLLQQTLSNYSNQSSSNIITTHQNLIISNFYHSNYDENEVVIKRLLKLNIVKSYANRYSILSYYRALNYFMLSFFAKAVIALNKTEDFIRDKYEWNAWVRLLRIMITMELKKWDLVEYQIKANAKYLAKNRVHIRPRVHLIHKLLNALISNNFDFKQTADKKADLLSRLENDPAVQWNINSPELIQFHNWFKAKRDQIQYQPIFNPTHKHEKPILP